MTSNSKAEGRFGKQDFRYVAEEDVYICPAGERLAHPFTNGRGTPVDGVDYARMRASYAYARVCARVTREHGQANR